MAMAAVCRAPQGKPCGVCPACRKAADRAHPDIRYIARLQDSKGKTKREITVDQVREIIADAQILPNESQSKVYIFTDGDFINTQAQNAALKLLEEPPEWVEIILCVTTPAVLLETVRSRCTEIMLQGGQEKIPDAETDAMAEKYLTLAESGNELEIWKWCESSNSLSTKEMSDFCAACAQKLTDALCGRRTTGMPYEKLISMEREMEKTIRYLKVSVSVKQLFAMLAIRASAR